MPMGEGKMRADAGRPFFIIDMGVYRRHSVHSQCFIYSMSFDMKSLNGLI